MQMSASHAANETWADLRRRLHKVPLMQQHQLVHQDILLAALGHGKVAHLHIAFCEHIHRKPASHRLTECQGSAVHTLAYRKQASAKNHCTDDGEKCYEMHLNIAFDACEGSLVHVHTLPSQLLQAAPDYGLLQPSPEDALPEGCNPICPKGFQPSHTRNIYHKILVRQLLALGCLLILVQKLLCTLMDGH